MKMFVKLKLWFSRNFGMWKAMQKYYAETIHCMSCGNEVPHYPDGITACLVCGNAITGNKSIIREYLPSKVVQTEDGLTVKFNLIVLRPHEQAICRATVMGYVVEDN